MYTEITISGENLSAEKLFEWLSEIPFRSDAITLNINLPSQDFRSIGTDVAVIVATVAGASTVISALISGIFQIIKEQLSNRGRIVIRGHKGTTVEVPANISKERLDELIEKARSIDVIQDIFIQRDM
jgi:hypothetical protein